MFAFETKLKCVSAFFGMCIDLFSLANSVYLIFPFPPLKDDGMSLHCQILTEQITIDN